MVRVKARTGGEALAGIVVGFEFGVGGVNGRVEGRGVWVSWVRARHGL